jgi:hypothetical protein
MPALGVHRSKLSIVLVGQVAEGRSSDPRLYGGSALAHWNGSDMDRRVAPPEAPGPKAADLTLDRHDHCGLRV